MSSLIELSSVAQPPALVRVRSLGKSFGQAKVLDGISFDIHPGEVRCIIGPSGSGKSTLLRCINALSTFDEGAIVVGENRVGYAERNGALVSWSGRDAAAFRSRIGFVSQHVNLFSHRTVIENVIEGPKHVLGIADHAARQKAFELLDRVGLADKHDRYPIQLSGGQQQRAAIARALAMQPQLILFDEATSALDPELVAEVLTVMRELARDGMTMIVVTHEMRFAAEVADRVLVLDAGRVIEDDSTTEVFNNPKHPRTAEFLANHFEFAGSRTALTA